MALENEHKHPSFEVLCKIILTLNIPADNIFYPENQYTENEKEQLMRLLSRCDGHCYLYPNIVLSLFLKNP